MQAVWLPSVTETRAVVGPWGHADREAETAVMWILRGGAGGGGGEQCAHGPWALHGAWSELLLLAIVNPGSKRGACTPRGWGICAWWPPSGFSLPSLPLGWADGRTLTFTPSNPHLPASHTPVLPEASLLKARKQTTGL